MGPPKKISYYVLSFTDLQRQHNYFEYRYDEQNGTYFLFNPVTGEKILQTDYDQIDRSQSLWCEPTKPSYIASNDAISSSNVHSIILNPVPYQSRRRGIYRKFNGYRSEVDAANHIITITKGFLARQKVRRIIRQRYCKIFDTTSKLYYFQDNFNLSIETSWYKPRLAYIDDILTNNILDPDDYLCGGKYSYTNGTTGPYYTLQKFGKSNRIRAENKAFVPDNILREIAVIKHEEIDLEKCSIGTIISWLDSSAVLEVKMTEYEFMRTVESTRSWNRIVKYMKDNLENEYIQLYGFFSFAKMEVPTDSSGLLDVNGEIAMDMCTAIIADTENKYNLTLKVFAMYAFHNILSTTAGRTEYLNVIAVTEIGEGRHIAIETFISAKIMIFNKYLTKINIEMNNYASTVTTSGLESSHFKRPTRRSADLVELTFICLADLSNQNEYREQMAYITSQPALYALKICAEESTIMIAGLRYLYYLCYRCESGQEILRHRKIYQILELAHQHHAGDKEVMYQCRRLELALKQDGWRGNIDEQVTNETIHSSASLFSKNKDDRSESLRSESRLKYQYEEASVTRSLIKKGSSVAKSSVTKDSSITKGSSMSSTSHSTNSKGSHSLPSRSVSIKR